MNTHVGVYRKVLLALLQELMQCREAKEGDKNLAEAFRHMREADNALIAFEDAQIDAHFEKG